MPNVRIAVLVAALLGVGASAPAGEVVPPRRVLVELFTSQG